MIFRAITFGRYETWDFLLATGNRYGDGLSTTCHLLEVPARRQSAWKMYGVQPDYYEDKTTGRRGNELVKPLDRPSSSRDTVFDIGCCPKLESNKSNEYRHVGSHRDKSLDFPSYDLLCIRQAKMWWEISIQILVNGPTRPLLSLGPADRYNICQLWSEV